MKTRKIYLFILILNSFFSFAQKEEKQKTKIVHPCVLSLQIKGVNAINYNSLSCIEQTENIELLFDTAGAEMLSYSYSILHCNADWTLSGLLPFEYMEGFEENRIEAYGSSFNTLQSYTHYKLKVPNSSLRLKLSGNYVIKVYEESQPNEVLLTACFSITENLLNITGKVENVEHRGGRSISQQLQFQVDYPSSLSLNPFSDLQVAIYQNGRTDNAVPYISPYSATPGKIIYKEDPGLLFESGNEYRKIEFLSHTQPGIGIKKIDIQPSVIHIQIHEDEVRHSKPYLHQKDQNGRYVIGCSSCMNPALEADYYRVHFTLEQERLPEGSIHLQGDFLPDIPTDKSRMEYNRQERNYEKTLLLKAGSYNYQYLFFKDGETVGSMLPIEGNFHQTENEYAIYIYYRPPGSKYDRLLGVTVLKNG